MNTFHQRICAYDRYLWPTCVKDCTIISYALYHILSTDDALCYSGDELLFG